MLKKKKWLSRVLSCALAVTLTAGTAVMTPVFDFAGIPTSITVNAAELWVREVTQGSYYDAGTVIKCDTPRRGTIYLDGTQKLSKSTSNYTVPVRVYASQTSNKLEFGGYVYTVHFTTAKLNQNPTISATSKTYNGSAVSWSATGGYGTRTVKFAGINGTNYSSSSTAPSTAGSYRMTVTYAGNENYNSWTGTKDFTISRATPSYTVPSNLTVLRGKTLADITLPTGWTWVTPSTSLNSVGNNKFKANYTPTDTTNYNSVNNVDVPVTVYIPTHTVTWKNYDGTTLETDENVEEDTTPEYNSGTPEKPADVQYTYTFSRWTPEISAVTEDITYTAVFDSTLNSYTVTWIDGDDNTTTDTVEYGTTPTAPTNPTKTATAQYSYTFSNWDKEITAVTGDVTYTALFDEFVIIHDDDVFVNSTTGTPEVFVTDCRTADLLTEGTDYTVTINNDSTVTVEGAGSYTGKVQKDYIVLDRKAVSSVANRRRAVHNAKANLSGEWYLPKNATNIKAGIARISTDDTNVINYNIYRYGVKKFSTLKTTSGKYSFSLLMNSTHAIQNLYTITCVTYEVDGKKLASLSTVFTSYPNPV